MPRNRTTKPEFYSDTKLAKVQPLARYFYQGIWVFSDDYGVVRGDPRWLKAMVFPYDDLSDDEIRGWLSELVGIARIIPFEANGENYYFIPMFLKHQKIDHRSQWRNPEPPADIMERSNNSSEGLIEDSSRTHRGLSLQSESNFGSGSIIKSKGAEDSASARRVLAPESESESEAESEADTDNACAKQIDINGVPPVKKAAKETKRKGAKKADPKKPDYIDQIIGVCSVIRFSYRRSCIHPNGKMHSQASEVLEFCKAQWGLLHSKHGWPEISSANILKYISLLYEAFMLEDETTGPDTDFARGCNFAFGAFRARIQKYAEMVANTNDSYGNPVFVPLDEPEDVLRYDPGCSHESLVRIEAFKQRRLKDGKLISRYVTASAPPHEKRWREERERIARGEPRSVTVEGDGNGKK